MAKREYQNGYLEKIKYWTSKYSEECKSGKGSEDNQKRILEKIKFFIGKQHDYLDAKVEESINECNSGL